MDFTDWNVEVMGSWFAAISKRDGSKLEIEKKQMCRALNTAVNVETDATSPVNCPK